MNVDRNGFEVLSRSECLDLLGRSVIGRVVVTQKALPAAFPVTFALLDEDIVFLSAEGSKLDAASGEEVVAFEVDDFDRESQTGWSVLVQGWAGVIVDPDVLARARALGLRPWVRGRWLSYVRIRTELVTGRRIVPLAPTVLRVPERAEPVDAACPLCGSEHLLPVTDGSRQNFICETCAACWHVDEGRMGRLRPDTCPGCAFKPMCTAAAARDRLISVIEAGRHR